MSLLTAWALFPAILFLICAGLGLLVDQIGGRRLPGALIVPVGLAVAIVIGGFTTWGEATAELTVPILLFLAVLGAGLSAPWRFSRPEPWPIAVAVGVFCVFGAPVLLSGEATFTGFIMLDDTATWLALTDRVMEHGRSLEGLGPSTYRATLDFNLAAGYPIGVFIPFGAAQRIGGGDLAWVFSPYLSFLGAMLSLALWEVLRAIRSVSLRALATFIAAQPALLVGYALWGGVKEMGAAALIALAAALGPMAVREGARLREALPLAIAGAALLGVLSPGGTIWLAPMLAVLAFIALRRFGMQKALRRAALFVCSFILLSLPVLASGLVPPTSKPLVGSDGEGNLRGPLDPLQVLGLWPSGDFRFDPDPTIATAVLVALGIGAALGGLWVIWRRRWEAPLLFASALLACAAIVLLGSPWAAGKALASAAPIALSLALLGALWAFKADRVAGGLLLVAICGGVIWSNVLAYGGASLAPYAQLRELEEIGKEFGGEGPSLMTEYSPYGARHFLRDADAEAASELRERTVPLREGGEVEKGYAADTDRLDLADLFVYRTLVLRRSPVRSRPPLPYRLIRSGETYEVWQRPEGEREPPLDFLPLGGEEPAAIPDCEEVERIAAGALRDSPEARLLAARHAPVHYAGDGDFDVLRSGLYDAWLGGSARGEIELFVDGEQVGSVRHELNNEGGYLYLGQARLDAGPHVAKLRFGGADLHPGSGGFPRPVTGPLVFAPAGREEGRIVSVGADEARQLCGGRWDWIEALG